MTLGAEAESARTLSPEEAFAVLGNETRLQILRTLGEADEPLAFSQLFDRVEYDTTANFSYHLDKLEDHFVAETDDGYVLRLAGRRVVEAVLSGTVTDDPVLERTEIEMACPLCGGRISVSYYQERVGIYCSTCGGTRSGTSPTAEWAADRSTDILGHVDLPPAGVRDRTPLEIVHAAEIWTVSKTQALARDVCPRCSAPVERSVHVCEDHDPTDGRCDRCNQEFGVTRTVRCTNCIFEEESIFTKHLLGDTDLMAFMIEHGIDPISPNAFHVAALEETIVSTDPFEARFTFTADGDRLTLTVGDDLSVIDVERGRTVRPE